MATIATAVGIAYRADTDYSCEVKQCRDKQKNCDNDVGMRISAYTHVHVHVLVMYLSVELLSEFRY
jgi:hypothetical protein